MRLAELLAALSLGIDLGFGQPMEHVLRQCLLALRIADRVGLNGQQRAAVYYTALLVNVGCHTDAHEQAKWFGDDIALKSLKYRQELRGLRSTVSGMRRIGAGKPPLRRLRTGVEFALGGYREMDGMIVQHARMARALGKDLQLPPDALDALAACYEEWDGHGWPGEVHGDAIPIASRIAQFAEFMEVAHRTSGVAGAIALAERRSGRQFDPGLVACLRSDAADLLDAVDRADTWQAVIAAEPALGRALEPDELELALGAIADFVDLKSPYTLGHSRAVAELAGAAGVQASLVEEEIRTLRQAALVSGFGRLGVSNAIWDKRGPLGPGEWERVRLYPYLTERMLQQSEALAPLRRIAVTVRERMDGSGYPRGLTGSAL
ncbi:MAG TPA: HD domain-containing phosphohydrolase, partial [Gemmatimonadales bacterium]|nr:HD domain-containing phosphohydrolase [Gemmatimonadales bacterium]